MESKQTSSELVQKYLTGDRQALERLYNLHAPAVTVFFLRNGFSEAGAHDLTREVFACMKKSLKSYSASGGSFQNWLATVARNAAHRHGSRRHSHKEYDLDLAQEAMIDRQDHGEAAAESQIVAQCVADLPSAMANLLRLRFVQGLTARAIALEENVSEDTVQSQLAQAMELLQKALKSRGFANLV